MRLIDGFWFPNSDKHFITQRPVADYQRPQCDYALGLLPPERRRHAVDVGAHVGLFTRRFLEQFDRVTAFEPTPSAFKCLRANARGPRVTLHRRALGETIARRQMHDLPCGWAYLADDPDIALLPCKPVRRIQVKQVTLDSLALEDVDLVKVDVQGAEAHVLRGAEHTLARWHPVVLVEEKAIDKTDRSVIDKTRALLTEFGYVRRDHIGADAIWAFG